MSPVPPLRYFFVNDTATTEIYTLSLHGALPISRGAGTSGVEPSPRETTGSSSANGRDRKSTRLNSSHANISYAVFCLKKKKTATQQAKREKTRNYTESD